MMEHRTLWTDPAAPRIWRLPGLIAEGHETLAAGAACTDQALGAIRGHGFNGIWFFCRLYDLMTSTVFPELNRPDAERHLSSLQSAINRARGHGVATWLYFNEPDGVPKDHPFWAEHRDVQGVDRWNLHGLCTSTPQVLNFFRQALESVFARLHGIEGVILITACENLTHCWSKTNQRGGNPPPSCPRCRDRAPADLVGDLLDVWNDVRLAHEFRVIAWNWEWAYWYNDPPLAILERLPGGFELLLDMEIGGRKPVGERLVPVREYALSVVGPSPRLTSTLRAVATRGIPVHAKLQINTTHELCTVPHLPVIANLHAKLKAISDLEISGFMGCWSIGCGLSLNTFAVDFYRRDPRRYTDEDIFLRELALARFGAVDVKSCTLAWRLFSNAWKEYPLDNRFLYYGPHNDALARDLSLQYNGAAMGRSFKPDAPGDDMQTCLGDLAGEELIAAYSRMIKLWACGCEAYRRALPDGHHELRNADLIHCLLRSTRNALRFYQASRTVMHEQGLAPPCILSLTQELRVIMIDEVSVCEQALVVVDYDASFGFHEEYQGYKFNHELIDAKLRRLRMTLAEQR